MPDDAPVTTASGLGALRSAMECFSLLIAADHSLECLLGLGVGQRWSCVSPCVPLQAAATPAAQGMDDGGSAKPAYSVGASALRHCGNRQHGAPTHDRQAHAIHGRAIEHGEGPGRL